MSVYTVPPEGWGAFCERLTSARLRDEIAVEVSDAASHTSLRAARLAALRMEQRGKERRFVVAVRGARAPEGDTLTVTIALVEPRTLRFEQAGESSAASLTAESRGARTVVVHFAGPVVHGELDGLP